MSGTTRDIEESVNIGGIASTVIDTAASENGKQVENRCGTLNAACPGRSGSLVTDLTRPYGRRNAATAVCGKRPCIGCNKVDLVDDVEEKSGYPAPGGR